MKLYICGMENNGDGIYDLIAETGEHLASHWCSNVSFAKSDLESGRPERQKEWIKRFGKYEVLRLGQDSMTKEKIVELNKKWFENHKEEEKLVPKPEIKLENMIKKINEGHEYQTNGTTGVCTICNCGYNPEHQDIELKKAFNQLLELLDKRLPKT